MKYLLDPGHGGLAFGHYLTPGKRSPEIPPGFYEGAVNRRICDLLAARSATNFECLNINPGPVNIPLAARCQFANQLHKLEPNLALISIHCNAAAKRGWSAANGFAVFLEYGADEKTRFLASLLHNYYDELGIFKNRGIKEANFAMIRKPKCPAVLLEMGFMTNLEDARKLLDPLTQVRIAGAIAGAMSAFAESVI
jgi:N-acetylmuramoyl-L-alanine amidase